MKKLLKIILITFLYFKSFSQIKNIPDGYILIYSQDFEKNTSINDFYINPVNTDIQIVKHNNNKILRLKNNIDTTNTKKSIIILDNYLIGDFICELNFDLKQLNINYPAELILILSFKDTLNFYELTIKKLNKDSINVQLIANDRGKVNNKFEKNYKCDFKNWNLLRIEREIINRTVRVYLNKFENPLFELSEWSLVMGHTGFGLKNGILDIDNIKVYSQTFIENKIK